MKEIKGKREDEIKQYLNSPRYNFETFSSKP